MRIVHIYKTKNIHGHYKFNNILGLFQFSIKQNFNFVNQRIIFYNISKWTQNKFELKT